MKVSYPYNLKRKDSKFIQEHIIVGPAKATVDRGVLAIKAGLISWSCEKYFCFIVHDFDHFRFILAKDDYISA